MKNEWYGESKFENFFFLVSLKIFVIFCKVKFKKMLNICQKFIKKLKMRYKKNYIIKNRIESKFPNVYIESKLWVLNISKILYGV